MPNKFARDWFQLIRLKLMNSYLSNSRIPIVNDSTVQSSLEQE